VSRGTTRKAGSAGRPSQSKSGQKKGIVATVVETVSGFFTPSEPNAVDMLKADHRKVEELFAKIRENENGNNESTFKKIKEELDVHAHVEETIFYPYLLEKGDQELQRITREGVEEHRQVKAWLLELDGMSGASEDFKARLKVLMEDVEHHVEEEEDEMFPLVEDQVEAPTLERLGNQMKAEKANFKGTSSATAVAS
jgi:iron-sulfur cluster repair protein YtfE (RIC family)